MDGDFHPSSEIDEQLRDNVAELVSYIQGEPGVRHGNDMRWGNKGGLVVAVAGRDKGRITCFDGDGKGRPPLNYIMEEYGYSFPQALEWAADWLGLSPDYKPDPKAESQRKEKRDLHQQEAEVQEQADKTKRVAKAIEIYDATKCVQGSPVEIYLAARGIITPLTSEIRYLPPQYGQYGAMVAVARDDAGNVRAVQRIFIDGEKKANIEIVKRTNGVMDGVAVRLPARQGEELILAEGPETGLSVWQAWGRETWVALGSVAKLADIVPTDRPIVIARDADVPNSPADKALNKAIMAMIERGASVFIAMPPKPTKPGYDFNDALQDYGEKALESSLEQSLTIQGNALPIFKALDDARLETQQTIRQFFNEAGTDHTTKVSLVNVGLGIGKTNAALTEAGRHIRGKERAEGFGT
jgi:phage/plasmid primase-like uncharacterized protein